MLPGTLAVASAVGCGARTPRQWALEGNTLAYIAGGGVVVRNVGSPASPTRQRFYCANHGSEAGETGARDANGYLRDGPVVYGEPEPLVPPSPETLRTDPVRERLKAVVCVALLPDESLLAVGESGHNPRVLVYSLAEDSSGGPVAIVHEHQFGIHALAFAPDLQRLASLGVANDGFLHIWRVRLSGVLREASNRCLLAVHSLAWPGEALVTTGLRFAKVWWLDGGRTLRGRSIVLGDLLHRNFIAMAAVDAQTVVVASEEGEVAVLVVGKDRGLVANTTTAARPITALAVQGPYVWTAHPTDLGLEVEANVIPGREDECSTADEHPERVSMTVQVTALLASPACLLALTATTEISRVHSHPLVLVALVPPVAGASVDHGGMLVFSASGAISRVQAVLPVQLSPVLAISLPLANATPVCNTLVAACAHGDTHHVAGDRYGNLYIARNDGTVEFSVRAHLGSVHLVCAFSAHGREIVASTSRDKTVQLFAGPGEWELLQTLADHKSTTSRILVHADHLYVASADRTVTVYALEEDEEHGLMAVPLPPWRFKTLPVALVGAGLSVVVATADKTVAVFSTKGDQVRTFKVYNEQHEPLALEHLAVAGPYLVAACSDRSVRVIELGSGRGMAAGWAHAEAVAGLYALATEDHLRAVSVGTDGCVFEWSMVPAEPEREGCMVLAPATPAELLVGARVVRKILSPSGGKKAAVARTPSTNRAPSPRTSAAPSPRTNAAPSPSTPRAPAVAPARLPSQRLVVRTPLRQERLPPETTPRKADMPPPRLRPPTTPAATTPAATTTPDVSTQARRCALSLKQLRQQMDHLSMDSAAAEELSRELTVVLALLNKNVIEEVCRQHLRDT